MEKILDGLYLIKNNLGANTYLIDNGKTFDLVDTGMFKETPKIIEKFELLGYNIKNWKRIILTHCHSDHIGGTADLARQSNAQILAHQADIPFILQDKIISGTYKNMMLGSVK